MAPARGAGALALSLLLATGLPPATAHAQEASLPLTMPTQSLEDALVYLARQAEWELAYSPDAVRNLRAPAVSGNLTPDQALRALLAGSGLVYDRKGNRVGLSRDPGDASVVMQSIIMVGKGNAITEGTGLYTTGAMDTAAKLLLTIQETPQSVSVVTRQKLDDFAMQTIDDAANSTTGVTVNHWSNDRSRYFSRGQLGQFLRRVRCRRSLERQRFHARAFRNVAAVAAVLYRRLRQPQASVIRRGGY